MGRRLGGVRQKPTSLIASQTWPPEQEEEHFLGREDYFKTCPELPPASAPSPAPHASFPSSTSTGNASTYSSCLSTPSPRVFHAENSIQFLQCLFSSKLARFRFLFYSFFFRLVRSMVSLKSGSAASSSAAGGVFGAPRVEKRPLDVFLRVRLEGVPVGVHADLRKHKPILSCAPGRCAPG